MVRKLHAKENEKRLYDANYIMRELDDKGITWWKD